ncbi:MAG: FtsX-like permease family protein [Candidatus Promineifilaceae bacterium]|nr:FtsX-like permease family protein [Candidatus Promineifilaceae bacterium]
MALSKFFAIAYRNLVRNGRRSALTALAVALGLTVVFTFSGMIEGMLETMLADNIRLSTGHLQIRNADYEAGKSSLLAQDLLQDGEAWAAQAETVPHVQSAAPLLWSSGLLNTGQESEGIRILGIEPDDPFHAPIREGVVAGEYINRDDRGRILVGRLLAEQMGIGVGQRVTVAASDANGIGQEGIFTVAGLIDTGFPSIDHHRIIMPMSQAQAFTDVGDRFSSLILTLDSPDNTAEVAANFQGAEIQVVTWEDLNRLLLESVESGLIFYYVLYLIVFLAVAVLIANTLLMAVFARAREIGILASLGMNRRQILLLFVLEGFLLALFGIVVGWILGLAAVTYMARVGISIPAETSSLVEGFAFGTTLKGGYAPEQFVILSLLLLIVVTLVSLYPAWFASRMEPVEALHAL